MYPSIEGAQKLVLSTSIFTDRRCVNATRFDYVLFQLYDHKCGKFITIAAKSYNMDIS